MQTILKTLFVGAILTIGTGVALAADPVIGTWKLNVAKSTFSPGPALKSQTRSYAESAQGTTLTIKTTAADGKESTATLTFKEDGKPYKHTGCGLNEVFLMSPARFPGGSRPIASDFRAIQSQTH